MNFRPSRISASLMLAIATMASPLLAHGFEVKDAVAITLKNNAEVRMKWHNFRATAEERGISQANYLPTIDLSYSTAKENRAAPVVSNGRVITNDFSRHGYNLSLAQNLFQGFITVNQVKQLDFTTRARYYEYLAEAEAQSQEAVRAYIDVVRYGKLVEIAEENYAVHKGIYQQILQRVSQGVGRRVDLEQVTGRMALAESNLINEIANLQDVSARYARIVGEAAPDSLAMGKPTDVAGATEVMPLAEKNNPRLLAAGALYHAAEAEIAARRGAFSPTLDLRASKDVTNNRDGILGRDDRKVLELVLNMNLYRGGADRARLMAATARLDEAEAMGTKACRDMRQQVTIAYNDTIKLSSQLESLRQHQLSTEKARDAYRQQFDIGQRTLLDMLDSENELFQARRDELIAELDLQLARYRVLGESGRLLQALQLSPNDGGKMNDDPIRAFSCTSVSAGVPAPAIDSSQHNLPQFDTPAVVSKTTAAAPDRSIAINTKVQFDLKSAVIREESKAGLDQLIKTLQLPEMAGKRFSVEGHTDRSGNAAANRVLSQQRADAVRNYLSSHGIAADRLQSTGYGDSMLLTGVAPSDPANRRVVVVLQDQAATRLANAPVLPKTINANAPLVQSNAAVSVPQAAASAAVVAPLPSVTVPATSEKATQLRRQLLRMAPATAPSASPDGN